MGLRWLITGGCGFIGTALVRRLLSEDGHDIRIVDNLSIGGRDDLAMVCSFADQAPEMIDAAPEGVELVVGDILDEALSHKVMKGIDVVVHLAANTGVGPSIEDPRLDCLTNVIGTFNYLDAARQARVKRFVFASSGAPVGDVEPPIHEELAPHPVSPYGASKLAGEGYCSAYKRSFGMDTVVLRFGNVYGPGSAHKNSVIAKFIRRALDNEVLEVYGDGAQSRDFIYIEDLVEAIMKSAIMPGIGGEVFQIATSRETTISELAQELVSILNSKNIHDIHVMNAAARIGDVKRNYSDTEKARKLLGWRQMTDLHYGLNQTVEYFLNH